jgi:hypothetical protein
MMCRAMVKISGMKDGVSLGGDPVIALAIPSVSLGGVTRSTGEMNQEILEVEMLARGAAAHALENEKAAGDFVGDSVTMITPTDLHARFHSPDDFEISLTPEACRAIAQTVCLLIMVNTSGDPKSEGLAIQASWAVELYDTPTLYVSELPVDRLGTWMRDYVKRGAISFVQARGDVAIAKAIRLFISEHIGRLNVKQGAT